MSKHTPGPWGMDKEGAIYASERNGNNMYPLIVHHDGINWEPPEAEANARLIAAAPDLLEAAKAALSELELWQTMNDGNDSEQVVALRAAIAKAEGGS